MHTKIAQACRVAFVLAILQPASAAEPTRRRHPGDEMPKEPVVREMYAAFARHRVEDGFDFGPGFWRESRRVARRDGLADLEGILRWCRRNRGEGPLIVVPLVALLPRAENVRRLERAKRSSNEYVRIYAQEFLTELEMLDSKTMERALGESG